MRRIFLATAAAMSLFGTTPRAVALEPNELALHAIFGGVAGVLGALTREAIDDARLRSSNSGARVYEPVVSATYTHSFPGDGRYGVRYNKPCSSFDGEGLTSACSSIVVSREPASVPRRDAAARLARRQGPVETRDERAGTSRVVRASADDAEIRGMIAATVASHPRFGGWSIIGMPKFINARISPTNAIGGVLGGRSEQYCVSTTMVVAGIPQPKSAYVRVHRTGSVATASVRPGNCIGGAPFPELELASVRA